MWIAYMCVASLIALLVSTPAQSCDNDDTDGLDVGLVLSGGGAYASTHVGALQIVEEMNIPVHCVVGTSMGAVIASLYASGYTSAELERIFKDNDWGAIFRGDTSRRDKPFLQKEREDDYFSNYIAGFDDGIRLPGGFVSMQGLRSFYRSLLFHIPLDANFDHLAIPYRAIVTDLSTGQARAIGQGDIVQAILASMAVPGAFAPREIDGRLYVDGGLSQQLPVQAARALGADIIIAIDTTVEAPEMKQGASVADVTQQLIRLTVEQNWRVSVSLLTDADVLIRPNLDDLSVSAFEKAATGIQSGRIEATRFANALLDIKARAAPENRQMIDRTARHDPTLPIRVENTSRLDDDLVSARFDLPRDKGLDRQDLHHRFHEMMAFGGLGEVDFARSTDSYVLAAEPQGLGRNLLQMGLAASNNFDGDSRFSIRGRLSRRPLSGRGGEIALAFEVGTNNGVGFKLYQPLGKSGRFFFEPDVFYRSEEVVFDVLDVRLGEFQQRQAGGRVRFGRELGSWGVFGLDGSLLTGELEAEIQIIDQFIPMQGDASDIEYSFGGPGLVFGIDTLDRGDWPRDGLRFVARGQRLFALDNNFTTDKYFLGGLTAFGAGNFGLTVSGRYEAVDNEEDDPVDLLQIGGFRRLSAYPEFSIPTNEYVYSAAELFRQLTSTEGIVTFPVYAGLVAEYAEAKFDFVIPGAEDTFFSAGFYLGAETPVGPLFVGAALGDSGNSAIFLHIGQRF